MMVFDISYKKNKLPALTNLLIKTKALLRFKTILSKSRGIRK
jgi:hypothetical protein